MPESDQEVPGAPDVPTAKPAEAPKMPALPAFTPPRYEYPLQFFEYKHLPPNLQEVSKPFGEMAHWIVHALPMNPERTAALRKLLEAKDCAVRAKLFK